MELLLIVAAPVPAPDLLLVDRLLVRARQQGMDAALVVNKCDLDADPGRGIIPAIRPGRSVPVLPVSARTGQRAGRAARGHGRRKLCCFAGLSAAWARARCSTPSRAWALETGDISQKIQRGKNTTRHAELLEAKGLRVLDTAGFSLLEMEGGMDPVTLKDAYPEFAPYEGAVPLRPLLSRLGAGLRGHRRRGRAGSWTPSGWSATGNCSPMYERHGGNVMIKVSPVDIRARDPLRLGERSPAAWWTRAATGSMWTLWTAASSPI